MPKRPRLPRLRRRKSGAAVDDSGAAATEPTPVAPAASPAEPATTEAPATKPEAPTTEDPAASRAEAPTATTPAVPSLTLGEISKPRRSRRPHLSRPSPPSLWPDWVRRTLALLGILLVGALGFGAGYLIFEDDEDPAEIAPGPSIVVESAPQPEEAEEIGFPEFATRNTTRVGGGDAIASAAGIALASYPSQGGVPGPGAVVVVPADSWQEALAATPLTADPIGAPVLLSDPDSVPDLTGKALAALSPTGLEEGDGVELFAVGDVAVPEGLETLEIDGADAPEIAQRVDAERARLSGEKDPGALLVVGFDDPATAMPAAAWAARSGDTILFVDGNEVPEATLKVVRKHPKTPIYALGPPSAVGSGAIKALERRGSEVTRIGEGAEDPAESSIEFARFVQGDFGWNINDPGHGFVIARADRPLDAVAAAPLSAGGKPGPLLVTEDGDDVPPPLSGFLADTQPGFVDDPSRALYNHIWLVGDTDALSVAFQAQVDELTKLAPVSAGTDAPAFGPVPGQPEADPADGADQAGGRDQADQAGGADGADQADGADAGADDAQGNDAAAADDDAPPKDNAP